jgi:hypothetical protein
MRQGVRNSIAFDAGYSILVLIYVVGGISGAVYHSMTTGAVDREWIAALLLQTFATLAVPIRREETHVKDLGALRSSCSHS